MGRDNLKLETFFDNFEVLADAPNSVQKLRELILQLAVQGKLVPQDPNDEPASMLLEKIKAEKQQMLKEKIFLKSGTLARFSPEDESHTIPKEWVWTRIGLICGSIVPNRDKPKSFSGGFPWITLSNFNEKDIKLLYNHSGIGLSKDEAIQYNARIIPHGSVLMSCIGRFGLVAVLNQDVVTNQQIHGFVIPKSLCSEYIAYVIKSQTEVLEKKATSTTISYLNKTRCESIPIPLPPLAEQKRIVAKVDQLMVLCDQLEERQQKRREGCVRINNGAIAQLLTSHEPDAFTQHWQRICDNFDLLYSVPENISKLRQAILQLAVQGKLVPQDPNAEPASVLLEKIKTEKERLIKEKKIKRDKPSPPIAVNEIPFELPIGWEWVRLETLVELITKGSSPKWQGVNYVDSNSGVLFITSENVRSYLLDLTEPKFVEAKFNEIEPRSILQRNDILMNIVGASIGRTAIYNLKETANINQAVCLIRMIKSESLINLSYLLHFFNSTICISFMFDKQVDNARANLSMGNIARFPIPIPPLAEQKRIVAKVDQLMALCDQLEAKLIQSQTNSEKLIDAAVRQVLM